MNEEVQKLFKDEPGLGEQLATVGRVGGWTRSTAVLPLSSSRSVVSDSLQPRGLQRARPPCPSPPRAYSNSCPSNR